ncbi:hypothetical protein [Bradyrhizobium sp.]|uniref:hypothetical protein n=1 Tax=Bradyrhizobium sp. TaxID=376 RepID=UPI0025BDF54F|nr:hypothetical protein [Bradyrhizobium sp.]
MRFMPQGVLDGAVETGVNAAVRPEQKAMRFMPQGVLDRVKTASIPPAITPPQDY